MGTRVISSGGESVTSDSVLDDPGEFGNDLSGGLLGKLDLRSASNAVNLR